MKLNTLFEIVTPSVWRSGTLSARAGTSGPSYGQLDDMMTCLQLDLHSVTEMVKVRWYHDLKFRWCYINSLWDLTQVRGWTKQIDYNRVQTTDLCATRLFRPEVRSGFRLVNSFKQLCLHSFIWSKYNLKLKETNFHLKNLRHSDPILIPADPTIQ